MASIFFFNAPNVLVYQIQKEKVVARNITLDYSNSDFVFPVIDAYIDSGNSFDFIFSNNVLVIPDPRAKQSIKTYSLYFNSDMIPISTQGEWIACFGIIKKENEMFVAGNIQLDQTLHLIKHFTITDSNNNRLPIQYT